MKRIILVSVFFNVIFNMLAQKDYDKYKAITINEIEILGNKINSDISLIRYDTIRRNDSCFIIKGYKDDSTLLYSITLKSTNPEKRHGRYVSYYPNHNIHCNGQYADNIAYGDWRYYKENGDLDTILNYNEAIQLLLTDVNKAFLIVAEENATFLGGDLNSFCQYLQKHIIYPDYALKREIEGKAIIAFMVDDSGIIVMPKALRPIDPDLSMEIFRLFSTAPRFNPAKQNGVPVCQQFVIPVSFKIKK